MSDKVVPIRPTPMHVTAEEFASTLWDIAVQGMKDEAARLVPELFFNEPKPRVLHVGDRVAWRGGWGEDPPRMARVKLIEIDCNGMAENGEVVESCAWEVARKGNTVVELDNGHWAYGDQIYPDMLSAQAKAMP